MKNLTIVLLIVLLAVSLNSQSLNGIGMGVAVSNVSSCAPSTGAAVTLCPVTGDGLYLAVGTGSFLKISTSSTVPVFTKINCNTATQSNTGLVASNCLIN